MNDTRLRERLSALRLEFARRLPERFAAAQEAVDALPGAPEALGIAYRRFHSLVGSAGTYGFDEISRLARIGETLLKTAFEESRPLQASDLELLRKLLADLQNVGTPTKA